MACYIGDRVREMTTRKKAVARQSPYLPRTSEARERRAIIARHEGLPGRDAKGVDLSLRNAYEIVVALYGDALKELAKY